VGRDDRGSFIQRHTKSIWISDRLIFADQAELVADVAEERQFPFGERTIEGAVSMTKCKKRSMILPEIERVRCKQLSGTLEA
jgi:hypothetical protein